MTDVPRPEQSENPPPATLTPVGLGNLDLPESPLVEQLIADLIPRVGAALVISPHSDRVIATVSSRLDDVTVLVATDGTVMPIDRPGLRVLRGTLDGPQQTRAGFLGRTTFELVLAADGLDDVVAPDSDVTWQARLGLVATLVSPGGCLVVGGRSNRTLISLLPGQPAPEHDDCSVIGDHGRSRPASPAQMRRAFAAAGLPGSVVHCLFGELPQPLCILEHETAADARPGELVTALVRDAISADASAATRDAVGTIAEAGALPFLSRAWLAVAGGSGRPVYAEMAPGVLVSGRMVFPGRWTFEPAGGSTLGWPDVPGDEDVETQLRRALAAHDLTAFRSVARAFGAWVRALEPTRVGAALALDGLHRKGSVFTRGHGAENVAVGGTTPDAVITAAWVRFAERRGTGNGSDVATDSTDQLVLWLTMSGVSAPETTLAELRRRTTATPSVAVVSEVVSVRQQLEQQELIHALRGAVASRNRQLSHREDRLRRLSYQLLDVLQQRDEAERSTDELLRSREYRVGRQVRLARDPREWARMLFERGAEVARRIALHMPPKQ